MPYNHSLTVRFRDCDMFQHVNNAVYLTYMEEARAAYWQQMMGDAYDGFGFVLGEVTCTYRSPALYNEQLDIEVGVTRIGTKSFQFSYRMTERASGREIATASSTQVMYDFAQKVSMPISDELRQRLEAFEQQR